MGSWEPEWLEKLIKAHSQPDQEHLECGVVTYGSLLIPEEIETTFQSDQISIEPVIVSGYKRCFSVDIGPFLENPSYPETAVLNVHETEGSRFNGLLIKNPNRDDLRRYADREFGYEPLSLSRQNVIHFHDANLRFQSSIYTVQVNFEDFVDRDLEGYPRYHERCLEGAKEWGDDFYEEFLRTTWSGGQQLMEIHS